PPHRPGDRHEPHDRGCAVRRAGPRREQPNQAAAARPQTLHGLIKEELSLHKGIEEPTNVSTWSAWTGMSATLGTGNCTACGNLAPCPARQHATSVTVATGEDPRSYDTRPSHGLPPVDSATRGRGQRQHRPEPDPRASPAHTGYRLGGRGRPAHPQ